MSSTLSLLTTIILSILFLAVKHYYVALVFFQDLGMHIAISDPTSIILSPTIHPWPTDKVIIETYSDSDTLLTSTLPAGLII